MGIIRFLLCFLIALYSACTPNIEKVSESTPLPYFDISGFFKEEIKRLSLENKQISKEVSRNGITESKLVSISDWEKEFSFFIESDINKPSWLASYEVQQISADTTIYLAREENLKTKKIQVVTNGNEVKALIINNEMITELYRSEELLVYYPDSLYLIKKEQNVKTLGNNIFEIKGHFQD